MFGNFLKKKSRLSSFRYMSSTVDITIKWQNISSFHHHRELNIFFKTVQFGEAELLIINNFWNILKKKNISSWVDFCIWGWLSKATVFVIYLLNYFFHFLFTVVSSQKKTHVMNFWLSNIAWHHLGHCLNNQWSFE